MNETQQKLQTFAREHAGETISLEEVAEHLERGTATARNAAKSIGLKVENGEVVMRGRNLRSMSTGKGAQPGKASKAAKAASPNGKRPPLVLPGDELIVAEVHLTRESARAIAETAAGEAIEVELQEVTG